MGRIRDWINRGDGKWFQVGNESLNLFETIGGFVMIIGLISVPLKQKVMSEIPTWSIIVVFLVSFIFMYIGIYLKDKKHGSNQRL